MRPRLGRAAARWGLRGAADMGEGAADAPLRPREAVPLRISAESRTRSASDVCGDPCRRERLPRERRGRTAGSVAAGCSAASRDHCRIKMEEIASQPTRHHPARPAGAAAARRRTSLRIERRLAPFARTNAPSVSLDWCGRGADDHGSRPGGKGRAVTAGDSPQSMAPPARSQPHAPNQVRALATGLGV